MASPLQMGPSLPCALNREPDPVDSPSAAEQCWALPTEGTRGLLQGHGQPAASLPVPGLFVRLWSAARGRPTGLSPLSFLANQWVTSREPAPASSFCPVSAAAGVHVPWSSESQPRGTDVPLLGSYSPCAPAGAALSCFCYCCSP